MKFTTDDEHHQMDVSEKIHRKTLAQDVFFTEDQVLMEYKDTD